MLSKNLKVDFLFYCMYFIGNYLLQYSELLSFFFFYFILLMKRKKVVRRNHQKISFPKFLLNLYPFISILRLKVSLLDESCFNWTENHSVTKIYYCLQGKESLVKTQTLAEMPKCHCMILGAIPFYRRFLSILICLY